MAEADSRNEKKQHGVNKETTKICYISHEETLQAFTCSVSLKTPLIKSKSHIHPFLFIIFLMMRDGDLVFQGAPLSSSGGLQSLHVITHGGALIDWRGRAVTWKPLSWAPILATDLMAATVLLASLRRGLLLALGNIPGPRRMQCEESTLDQFILQRVDELFCLSQREDKKTCEPGWIERIYLHVDRGRVYFCCEREGNGRKCCLMGVGKYLQRRRKKKTVSCTIK